MSKPRSASMETTRSAAAVEGGGFITSTPHARSGLARDDCIGDSCRVCRIRVRSAFGRTAKNFQPVVLSEGCQLSGSKQRSRCKSSGLGGHRPGEVVQI